MKNWQLLDQIRNSCPPWVADDSKLSVSSLGIKGVQPLSGNALDLALLSPRTRAKDLFYKAPDLHTMSIIICTNLPIHASYTYSPFHKQDPFFTNVV